MKIIFLDIDGVLNCEQTFLDRIYKTENNEPLSEFYEMQKGQGYMLDIDEEKVQILGEITKITGAKVVLSSSWRADWKDGKDNLRFLTSKALQYLFDKYSIDIIGITPYINNRISRRREDEIKEYLNHHKDIEYFCVIDDDTEDLQTLKEFLIETNFYRNETDNGGLQRRHIEEAVKILCPKKVNKRTKKML